MQSSSVSPLKKEEQLCIQFCRDCNDVCLQTIDYALKAGGKVAERNEITTLLDCAEICQLCSNFMQRESVLYERVCALCSEICARCAQVCEQFHDDAQMRSCAEICRKCSDACQRMSVLSV